VVDVRMWRVAIAETVGDTLLAVFNILGLRPIDRM